MSKRLLRAIWGTWWIVMCGCAAFPHRGSVIDSGPHRSLGCQKIGITTSFSTVVHSDLSAEIPIDPDERRRGSVNPAWLILGALEVTNLFWVKPQKGVVPKYFISFKVVKKTVSNGLQRAHLWLSNLTAGIIPGYGDGKYFLQADVFADGKKIKEYESTKIGFRYYHGLVFLPLNFWHSTTLASVAEEFLPSMTGEIVNMMVRDGLISCSKSE